MFLMEEVDVRPSCEVNDKGKLWGSSTGDQNGGSTGDSTGGTSLTESVDEVLINVGSYFNISFSSDSIFAGNNS